MNKLVNKIFLGQFFLLLFLEVIQMSTIMYSSPQIYQTISQFQSYFLEWTLLIYLFSIKFTNKKALLGVILIGLGLYSYFSLHISAFLFLSLLMIISSSSDYKQLIKTAIFGLSSGIIAVFFLMFIGAIPDIITSNNGKLINPFGFFQTNTLATCILFLALLHILQRFEKWNKFDWLIQLMIFGITLYLDVMTLLILVVLVNLVLLSIKSKKDHIKRIELRLLLVVSLIFIIILIVLMVNFNYNIAWQSVIDTALSGRLTQAHGFYLNYGVTLFGQSINNNNFGSMFYAFNFAVDRNAMVLDSGVARSLINFGIVYFILFYGGYFLGALRALKKNDYIFALAIIILIFFSFSESILLSPSMNFIIVIISAKYFNNEVIGEV